MAPKIVLRKAENRDVVNLVKFLRHANTVFPAYDEARMSENGAYQFILTLVQKGYVIVADLSGNLVGTIGCAIYQRPWSAPKCLTVASEWFFIQPHLKDSGLAGALLSKALKRAVELNADFDILFCDPDLDALSVEFLAKLRLRPAGRLFTNRMNRGHLKQPNNRPPIGGDGGPIDEHGVVDSEPAVDAVQRPAGGAVEPERDERGQ